MANKELTVEYFAENAADIVARVHDGEEFCFKTEMFCGEALVLLSKELSETFDRVADEQNEEKYPVLREHDFDSEDVGKMLKELDRIISIGASGEPYIVRVDGKPACLSLKAILG